MLALPTVLPVGTALIGGPLLGGWADAFGAARVRRGRRPGRIGGRHFDRRAAGLVEPEKDVPEGGPPLPVVLSVNVGMPRDVEWEGRTVHTGVWKYPVEGPHMVRRLNIDGDGQGDLAGHGGEQRAVLVYQIQSYRHWEEHFGRHDLAYGQFGENLTVDGLPDDEVCIGDRYRIGEAELEVTQPRVTCYRVGLRFGEPELPALLVSHHRPGFYVRVIREGLVQAGDEIVRTRIGPGQLTVAATDALLYLPERDPTALRVALSVKALSPGWAASFRDLLGAADGRAPTSAPAWPGFRPLQVVDLVPESVGATSIHLASPDGEPLPRARGGQFLSVRVPSAATPAPVRSYSLSSAPGAGTYRITVKHEPHGLVSGYLSTELKPGALIEAAAPRGDFVLDMGSSPVVFLSAGIGVTPVIGMLHELASLGSARAVWWIHAARDPRQQAFAAEAQGLLAALPDARQQLFYTAATEDEVRHADALAGRPTAANLGALGIPPAADAYLCGPGPFLADMHAALADLGFGPDRIHAERFGALPSINPGVNATSVALPHRPPGPVGNGPLVTFARSGISTPFAPTAWPNLLELAEACDIATRWSCRSGVCHTCVTGLLAGEVAYAPEPLEAPAPGDVLVCCAQPTTDVVVDL